ncbi:hypothetical protein NEOKW01_0808 [Nematocida sp. AWRm80]|nr:hypothetical protein NEOKW01_0808 [Nematocida sp. AWRm80]
MRIKSKVVTITFVAVLGLCLSGISASAASDKTGSPSAAGDKKGSETSGSPHTTTGPGPAAPPSHGNPHPQKHVSPKGHKVAHHKKHHHPKKGGADGDRGLVSSIFFLNADKAPSDAGKPQRFLHGPFVLVTTLIVGLALVTGGVATIIRMK